MSCCSNSNFTNITSDFLSLITHVNSLKEYLSLKENRILCENIVTDAEEYIKLLLWKSLFWKQISGIAISKIIFLRCRRIYEKKIEKSKLNLLYTWIKQFLVSIPEFRASLQDNGITILTSFSNKFWNIVHWCSSSIQWLFFIKQIELIFCCHYFKYAGNEKWK